MFVRIGTSSAYSRDRFGGSLNLFVQCFFGGRRIFQGTEQRERAGLAHAPEFKHKPFTTAFRYGKSFADQTSGFIHERQGIKRKVSQPPEAHQSREGERDVQMRHAARRRPRARIQARTLHNAFPAQNNQAGTPRRRRPHQRKALQAVGDVLILHFNLPAHKLGSMKAKKLLHTRYRVNDLERTVKLWDPLESTCRHASLSIL